MVNTILNTKDDWIATLLRVSLGVVMFPHGAQKLFGWFGGGGVSGTLGFLDSMGIPVVLGLLVILAESVGSVALIAGFGGRVAAAAIAAVMIGAVSTVHLSNGFFMNWSGTAAGEGFEYHILALAIAAAVFVKGSGAASVDRLLVANRERGTDAELAPHRSMAA